jgi:peptidoglycan/LPS O-acetylase OafA/YrhL
MILHANVWHRASPYLPSASLAVDFFFLLSGFVLAYTYDDRLARGHFAGEFLRRRIVRLAPLVALGSLVGMAAFAARGHSTLPELTSLTLANATLVPAWFVGRSEPFPLNGVNWSLLVELLLNLAYALVAPRLSTRVLAATCFASGAVLLAALVHFQDLPLLRSALPDLVATAARGVFSFSAGVLIYRKARFGRQFGLPTMAALSALLLLSFAPNVADTALAAPFNAVCIMLLYPAVLWAGIQCQLDGVVRKAAEWSGAISYPVYALHKPILGLAASAFGWLQTQIGIVAMPMRISLMWVAILLCVLVSDVALRRFDEPVRRHWSRRIAAIASSKAAVLSA